MGEESPLDQQHNVVLDEEERKILAQLSTLIAADQELSIHLQYCSNYMVDLSWVVGIKNIQFDSDELWFNVLSCRCLN